jgi:hypothetical protein
MPGYTDNRPDPWSYQVDILVPTMDLSAGKTWDQIVAYQKKMLS